MVMESPSPQCVGREFVRQYYTLLHEAPEHLHRFYSHNSSFVHGGVEKPGEEQPPVMGQQEIHKKITSLNFCDCHAKIRQVDSQATVGSAVVVQVTGELSNNGEPMRRFMQTFVLAPQSPKKYYVHNDIFRYQDEVFHDNEGESDMLEEAADSEPEILEQEPQPETVQDPVSYYEAPAPPLSNGSAHLEEVQEPPVPASVPQMEPEKIEVEEPQPEVEYAPQEPEKIEPEPEPVMEPASEVAKPISWASLASKNTGGSTGQSIQGPTAVVKPQPVPKPEPKAVDLGPSPQPQRGPRWEQHSGPQRMDRPRERDNSRSGPEIDDTRRSRYPDSHQLFVGNLPHNIAEKELKAHFEAYGKVVEVRINRKSTRDVPNFGFVVFEEPETVQRVLEAKPIMLHNDHRLNVEEKKQRSEQGGRPGSGTRAPRGGMGRGGLGGPMRGGRGGGPPSGRGGGPPSGPRGGFGAPRR